MNNRTVPFFMVVMLFAVLPGKAEIIEVEVRSGNTLHGFANKYLKDPSQWPDIYKLNKDTIKDPDMIYPGQKINIPQEMLKDKVGDLTKIKEEVKVKKREKQSWQTGELAERLFPEDGIRTGEKSIRESELSGGKRA